MKKELIILDEDKTWARTRIAELEKAILDLGPEFYDVFNQSSETWHDNAPFDALRDRQSVLDAELQNLRMVMRRAAVSVPRQKKGVVGIGSRVELENKKGVRRTIKIAGDWTPHAGQTIGGITVVSVQTPLAQELLGIRVGVEVKFGKVVEIVI